jgi:ATP-grasp in the biosynthetic pathway with Ter operon
MATRPTRVLVFPAGTEIGLEIHKSLSSNVHFELVGAGSMPDHASFTYATYIDTVPFITDPNCLPTLEKICADHDIDVLFPAHDAVLLALATSGFSRKVIMPNASAVETCCYKSRTYQLLKDIVPTPAMYAPNAVPEWPVFTKPDFGNGSRGASKITNQADLDNRIRQDPTLLVLEYLPGSEYTIDCFTDRHGKLLFSGGRKRNRINNGISVNTTSVSNPEFPRLATKINERMNMRGAWFFQLKEDRNGQLCLLEVAPRIAGTMGYHRHMGVNFPALSIYDALDIDVSITPNTYALTMDRALANKFKSDLTYRNVYIDLDDTILIHNKVHLPAVSFIYQCRNRNIPVHLVTRHAQSLEQTLANHGLTNLFTNIHHLTGNEPKSSVINQPDAIFIDDSHSEREDARQKAVAVFAVDMLPMLINE